MGKERGVLIVHGHRGVCAALAEYLHAAGLRVVCAAPSLAEAIPFLTDPLVDAIVCDPVTLGADIRQILGLLATSGQPIIVQSILLEEAEMAACTEAGVAAVLHTGRPPAVLLYALEVAITAAQPSRDPSAPEKERLQQVVPRDQRDIAPPVSLPATPRGQTQEWNALEQLYARLAAGLRHIEQSLRSIEMSLAMAEEAAARLEHHHRASRVTSAI